MASAFSDLMTIANDPNYQSRVVYGLQVAAVNVMAEAANVTAHAQRVGFATHVLSGSHNVLSAAVAVLTNSTIAAESDVTKPTAGAYGIPDSDIQFAVNSLFNALAGVSN